VPKEGKIMIYLTVIVNEKKRKRVYKKRQKC